MLIGPARFSSDAFADPPPCAHLGIVPDDLPVEGEFCLDTWLGANSTVYQILFGPGSVFSLDTPGYRLFDPVSGPGFFSAATPLGTPFVLEVFAFVSAGLTEPGALNDLPPNLVATAISQQVSGGYIYGQMMRKSASVPIEAIYFARRNSSGQMVFALHVLRIMPFELAESFRTNSDFFRVVPPLCEVDCNGDGTPEFSDPEVCAQAEIIEGDFEIRKAQELANFKLCMSQYLRRGILVAVTCGLVSLIPGAGWLLTGSCLVGGAVWIYEKSEECETIRQNIVNAAMERDMRIENLVRDACASHGTPMP